MAKKSAAAAGQTTEPETLDQIVEQPTSATEAEQPTSAVPDAPVAKLQWVCSVEIPTPIAHPQATVEADSAEEAEAEFRRMNGVVQFANQVSVRKAE